MKIYILLLLLVGIISQNAWANDRANNGHYTVIVEMEARRGKEELLKKALEKFIENLKSDGCLNCVVKQDFRNKSKFTFSHEWESKEVYEEKFKVMPSYVEQFHDTLARLLVRPWHVSVRQKVKVFLQKLFAIN